MDTKAIVSEFLGSEYFHAWQSEQIESGGYSRNSDKRDRYNRCCYEAAENGADGSTHAEHIQDMRAAFDDWLSDQHRGRLTEFPYRLQSAAHAYFNELEAWHEANGSLWETVG